MTDLATTTPPRRVLITGAAGFAGHHLTEHLLAETDWELVLLDGLTYAGDVDRLTKIAGWSDNLDRVDVHWHDLRSPIGPALDDRLGHIDDVLHLAANSHVDRSIAEPASFFLANAAITVNLLEWARSRKDRALRLDHFVQISTDEVYGPAADGHAHVEWEDPLLPSNPYAGSKGAQELAAIAWWRTYGVPVVITNTMNLFGERQNPEKMVAKTMKTLRYGGRVPVHAQPIGEQMPGLGIAGRVVDLDSDPHFDFPYHPTDPGIQGETDVQVDAAGKMTVRDHTHEDVRYVRGPDDKVWRPGARMWLHARNHADALRWVLAETTPARYGDEGVDRPDRWHVCGQVEIDNLTMVEQIAAHMGVKPSYDLVDFHSSRPGHDLRYALDATKITDAGWTPPVPFEESLERTVAWSLEHADWLR